MRRDTADKKKTRNRGDFRTPEYFSDLFFDNEAISNVLD